MKKSLPILFLLFSSIVFGQSRENKPILFDGLYETKCEYEEDDDEGTQNYLRFYANGTVISISTVCEGTADELIDWFNASAELTSIGNYKITGRKINFSLKGKTGIVHYKGQIIGDNVIRIKWKSSINGEKGREEYKFIYMTGLK